MKVLITGAAGFIGHHLVEHIIRVTRWHVICIDKLSYASKGWSRLKDAGVLSSERITTITWDLSCPFSEGLTKELNDIEIIIHMAADTHVDRSIAYPVACIKNNVMSTVHMLEFARTLPHLKMFQYFSTDEVFGAAPGDTCFHENDKHNPGNPYSASKAAAEDICVAYGNTYQLPIIITNLMNVFGERQYVEKFIPMTIKKIRDGQVVDIHTDAQGKSGSRHYIHARNVASAVLFILEHGQAGQKYNIAGECEKTNLEVAQKIAEIMGQELNYRAIDPLEIRPGHDWRYSLNGSKLFEMGWQPPVDFDHSLTKMVKWTLDHPEWLEL